jgi:hypothetical protein
MIGTALGLLPGVVLLSVLSDHLLRILDQPSLVNLLGLFAFLALWIGVTWLLQKFVSWMRREA